MERGELERERTGPALHHFSLLPSSPRSEEKKQNAGRGRRGRPPRGRHHPAGSARPGRRRHRQRALRRPIPGDGRYLCVVEERRRGEWGGAGVKSARACAPSVFYFHASASASNSHPLRHTVEALVGTLRAAKKRGIIAFEVRKKRGEEVHLTARCRRACSLLEHLNLDSPFSCNSNALKTRPPNTRTGRAPPPGRPRRGAGDPAEEQAGGVTVRVEGA